MAIEASRIYPDELYEVGKAIGSQKSVPIPLAGGGEMLQAERGFSLDFRVPQWLLDDFHQAGYNSRARQNPMGGGVVGQQHVEGTDRHLP